MPFDEFEWNNPLCWLFGVTGSLVIVAFAAILLFSLRAVADQRFDPLLERMGLSHAHVHTVSVWKCAPSSDRFLPIYLYGSSHSEVGLIEFEGMPHIDARYTVVSPYTAAGEFTGVNEDVHRWGFTFHELEALWSLSSETQMLKMQFVRFNGQINDGSSRACELIYL